MIKLLIVDDEISSIRIIKAFLNLEALGLELVGEAENGCEAMAVIQSENRPQIIITDMNMPVMDGTSLLQYLLDCAPDIKTIVISGYFDFPYTHAAITAKVRDYLLKPIDPEKLNSAVMKCIEEIQNSPEQAEPTVSTGNGDRVDLSTYQRFLKQVDIMRSILDYGNRDNIVKHLRDLLPVIHAASVPEAASHLAVKLFSDTLRHYCIEQDHPPVETVPPEWIDGDSAEIAVAYLESLYLEGFTRIQQARNRDSVEASLESIQKYIRNNYRKPLRLEAIATKFFINKEYLSTQFHKKFGETLSEYVLRLKMEDAILQLKHTNLSVNSISRALGYEDPAYFNRQFKNYVGVSPGKYRSQLKKCQ